MRPPERQTSEPAPAVVVGEGDGAEVPVPETADGEGIEELAAAVAPPACLEPKIADAIQADGAR